MVNILLFFIPLAFAFNIYLIYNNPKVLELKEKIKVLEEPKNSKYYH